MLGWKGYLYTKRVPYKKETEKLQKKKKKLYKKTDHQLVGEQYIMPIAYGSVCFGRFSISKLDHHSTYST
jgi:hypothetical protein